MANRTTFFAEMQRHIQTLGGLNIRLSLLSVNAPDLQDAVIDRAVKSAAMSLDLVGALGDGSVGLLALNPVQAHTSADIERRYLLKLQAVLMPLARQCEVGPVIVRAAHSLSQGLTDVFYLMASLSNAPVTVLAVPKSYLHQPSPTLFSDRMVGSRALQW